MERLQVKLGIDTPKHVDDLMGFDELLQATTPKAGRLPALASEFAARAAANLHRSAGWPANLMAMHYAIARDGLSNGCGASRYNDRMVPQKRRQAAPTTPSSFIPARAS